MPGMCRSITTTSGASSRTRRTASAPWRRLADDLDALLLEQVAQAGPEEVVVVDEQHADAAGGALVLELHGFAHDYPPWSGDEV